LTKRSVVGVVLAGGSSRRLGGIPKGLEIVGGKRSIDRVAEALRAATSTLVLAANDPDAGSWLPGVAVVADRFPGTGGLAGVDAALAGGSDIVVVAWDMPFVTSALVELIIGETRHHESRVTVPESRSPYGFEPFCAYYAASVQPTLAEFLRGGGGPARDFLARVTRVHRIPIAAVAGVGDPERLLLSFNTRDDLERARAMASAK
jgi:molybdopterin-guanine dinucleotide biosynthesis protein A